MQQKRKSSRRRGARFLVGLLSLAVITGIAFGGALLWQNAQEAVASPSKESSPASQEKDDPSSSQPEAFFDPQDILPKLGEVDPEPELPVSAGSFQAELPTDPPVGDANFAGPQWGSGDISGDFAIEGQLPRSASKVDSSYFDDAIFFGDSISTGITAYNICNNTACIAAIGVSPSTILDTPYIPTSDGSRVTVLEAAKEYGDRSKVYIMLGGNGLWQEKDAFITDYQTFIDAVREQYPSAIIYIQAMTPVADFVAQTYPTVTPEKVAEYNLAIAQLATQNKLPFVNVFEALCDENGLLPDAVSADGLHLSPEYYFKWFDYLKTHTVEGS